MTAEALIRRARVDDAAALAKLAERTFRDAFTAQNEPENVDLYVAQVYGEEQQRREILDPRITTLVAELHGELIAYVQTKDNPVEIEIARIYVDRRFHGGGLAKRLIDCVVENARAAHASRVWLGVWEHNPRAIAFYKKCGFRLTGSHPFLLGNDLQTDLEMTLDL